MKIDILLGNIKELKAVTTFDNGDIKTKISFETRIAPQGIARLLNLQRQGVAMDVLISSNQGTFDLVLASEVSVASPVTGQVESSPAG